MQLSNCLENSNMYSASVSILISGLRSQLSAQTIHLVSGFVYIIAFVQAGMPIASNSDVHDDHYFVMTMVDDTMWFMGYRGVIDPTDFAYACSVHAQGGIVTMPGAFKSFAFKCLAAEM